MAVDIMTPRFCHIAITPEIPVEDEAEKIIHLLTHGGFERVHLRHPGASSQMIASIMKAIPTSLLPRVSVHSCNLSVDMPNLTGVHLSSKDHKSTFSCEGIISKSCHSLEEIDAEAESFDYLFLSPVYDSISKTGYRSRFNHESGLREVLSRHNNVIALGGVTPQNIYDLKKSGFAGAAMLGAIPWDLSIDAFKTYTVTDNIVQFITDGTPHQCIQQTIKAVEGGIRWVQLRMKDATAEAVKQTAREILPLCRQTGTTFIINDNPYVALEVGADGVHLGKNDMPPSQARDILGSDAIIGATANCLDDIKRVAAQPIDYIGLGPLHFTGTKKNLAPVLGIEGVSEIIDYMRDNAINIPVVVIGGITVADVPSVIKAGADGVAVCGAIAHATDITKAAKSFIDII